MNNILINLLLILILFIILNISNFEYFQNYKNPFFDKKSFCSLNNDTNKCECTYQKDGINIPFNSYDNNCKDKCVNRNISNCNKNILDNIYYYCKKNGKCVKYQGTNKNSYISTNNCGTDKLTNQILLPYITKESCENSLNICDKYNNNNMSNEERKKKCLENTMCGYCTNEFGIGKCVQGNSEGPLDKNINCVANNFKNNNKNKYEYGNFLFN